jgi:outer membrane receptor protein involved in Fe transport
MKKIKVVFICTFYSLILAVNIFAQTSNQFVSGTVKDQNGAVISGARVFLVINQIEQVAVTDTNGKFTFENVLTGNRLLRISAAGFAEQTLTINSEIDKSKNVEVILSIEANRVTVTAEVGQELERENVPQAVNLIDDVAILQRATSVLAQVGEEEAGLNVQRTSPTIGAIYVRGLTGKNVVTYVDGVRYTTGAQRGGINTFFNLNDPTNLQSIEILRGASSAQYGSDALGGSINLITKNPYVGSNNPELHGEITSVFNSADRSLSGSTLVSYGTNRLGGYVNLAGRRINTLRTARGLDSHAAVTRFLGLPSNVINGKRLPDTEFSQYGGSARLNYSPNEDQQFIFHYQRGQQDDGKRYDQLLGGDGNLIADLQNLMLDFGYLRYVKQNLGVFDSGSFTVSYNSQREERVNQGGQGNPFGDITHQYERTSVTGLSFFLDKQLPARNAFTIGGDFYHEKINSPAFTFNPQTNTTTLSRPRVPDEARFDQGGMFVQNAWEPFANRVRISGALRYSAMQYKVREADAPVVSNRALWQDDSLHVRALSGRIGTVVRLASDFRVAFNYSRGFRYPSMTDLGTLGLTGDGFEVDYLAAQNLGGTVGTTADLNARSTNLAVEKQRPETSNNFDLGFRYQHKRFDTELTGFVLNLNETITKQALILPLGAVGQFLGDQRITNQLSNGVVFVPLSTSPVLVRSNYSDARIYGLEYELEARLTRDVKFQGNFTFIRAADKATGAPPNIEGGTPPPTGFVSFRYEPSGKMFWIELYSNLAAKQTRLSTLDLSDRRTGAIRTRAQIANFFRRGACVYGLTNNQDGVCGSNDEIILLPTGETLTQVQNRVLGNANSAPLFTRLPAYALTNLRGAWRFNENSQLSVQFENIFDRPYRNPSWGIDGSGRSLRVAYRYRF